MESTSTSSFGVDWRQHRRTWFTVSNLASLVHRVTTGYLDGVDTGNRRNIVTTGWSNWNIDGHLGRSNLEHLGTPGTGTVG